LHAYQCHVLLDWRELRDDVTHPWGTLCYQLAGRGVSSLEDALRALQLKPLHDAFRELLAPTLMKELAETHYAAQKKTKKVDATPKDGSKVHANLTAHVRTLLERSHQLASTDHERAASSSADPWSGDVEQAVAKFEQRVTLALNLGAVEKAFTLPWPEEAHRVLPTAAMDKKYSRCILASVVGWAALLALGEVADPSDPECTAARILDQQRLREPIADALEHLGSEGDDRWRAAARIRALLAHKPWAPGDDTKHARAPFSWLQDPDVAWLIGVHSYQDVRYFNKESFEQLLWWMALPALLRIATGAKPDPIAIETLEEQIEARTKAAVDASFQLDGLFAPQAAKEKQPS
jgi:hypothetical protein